MRAEVFWLDNVWAGRLGLAPRPRGGDWLQDEVTDWERQGAKAVVSLLTAEEEADLGLENEAREVLDRGMVFRSLSIPDRGTPPDLTQLKKLAELVDRTLGSGKDVVIHCRQGIGRTGLMAAYLLLSKGWPLDLALERLSTVRGVAVPETKQQVGWLEGQAASLAVSDLVR